MSPERVETEVDGKRLSLSNLDKVLYPEAGFTKRDVLDYYARIADVMLPHVRDRAMTLRRYPNGVDEPSFFEKHAPSHMPDWVRTATVPPTSGTHKPIKFAVVCDRPTLVWAANLAALEFHVPLWRVSDAKTLPAPPDYLVFDLDPGPGTSIVECCRVARWIADLLDERSSGPLFAKTSGSKGLQLYLGVDRAIEWTEARDQAHELARSIEHDHPDVVVSSMKKELRKGRVLIDWSQNQPSKTTVAAYSLRARPAPTVSTPVTWDEVDACAKRDNPDDLRFVAKDVLARVDELGDLMAPLVAT